MDRRFAFDTVAQLYEATRPSYPEALFEDIRALTGAGPGASVLEIGTGTGKATIGLLGAGYQVLGLEPGENMAAIARHKCSGFSGFQVEVSMFEKWLPAPRAFDVVVSAQAFHWLDRAVRFKKAAFVLKPGGHLAVMANRPYHQRSDAYEAIHEVYRAHAPHLAEKVPAEGGNRRPVELEGDFLASGLFEEPIYREYPWAQAYSARAWVELLATQSDHTVLDEAVRTQLLASIEEAIVEHGGEIVIDYSTMLVIAARKRAFTPPARALSAPQVQLRETEDADLAAFFDIETDPVAIEMAAFTSKNPFDREAFDAHWRRILADESVCKRTILVGDGIAGVVASYLNKEKREVFYWIAREAWGKGVSTKALTRFVRDSETARPLYAHVAKHNAASLRVLQKCGFAVCGESKGFAPGRGEEIEEFELVLE